MTIHLAELMKKGQLTHLKILAKMRQGTATVTRFRRMIARIRAKDKTLETRAKTSEIYRKEIPTTHERISSATP